MKPVQDNSDSSDTEIQKKTLHFSLTDNQRGRHPAEQPSCGHLSDDRACETQRQVWDHRWCPWKRPADRCGNGPRQGAVTLVLICLYNTYLHGASLGALASIAPVNCFLQHVCQSDGIVAAVHALFYFPLIFERKKQRKEIIQTLLPEKNCLLKDVLWCTDRPEQSCVLQLCTCSGWEKRGSRKLISHFTAYTSKRG